MRLFWPFHTAVCLPHTHKSAEDEKSSSLTDRWWFSYLFPFRPSSSYTIWGFAKYLPTLLSLSSALNHLHQSKPNNVCEQFQTFSQECNTSGVGLWKWWKVSHQRWDADAGCRWERQCADWTVSLHLFIVMNSAQFYCVFRLENAHGLLSKVM